MQTIGAVVTTIVASLSEVDEYWPAEMDEEATAERDAEAEAMIL